MYSHYKKEAERGNQASKVIDALQRSREATSSPSQSRENSSLLFNRYPPPLFIEGAQGKGSKSRAPSEEYSLDDVSQFLDTNRSASESSGDADLTRWIKKEHYRYITEVEYLIEKKLLHLSRQEDPVGAREQDLEYLQLSDENQKFGERFRQIYAKAVQLNAQNESFRAQFTSLGKSKKSVKGGGSDSLYEKVLVEEYDGNVVRFISWLKQFLEETMILSEDDVEKGAPEDETGTPNRKIKNTRDHLIKEIKKEKARQRIDFWKNA
ncbi:hypothetical protein AGDE_12961 [Angomonas deanei]|uniref:Uncharacterized protein n=1 Tax=Angomonas deanei TaxID=59799 RepID=A0A7G2CH38_9TRYP|nr:hypothetical protein AGDE_12961 [Angomonas deanei]CAD2218809.1 hypothetical protein, conserved [Angomonas deanei]|eukprot:EPY23266.1 hypothetical protein AGDE_12961 [Angomonas deanei]